MSSPIGRFYTPLSVRTRLLLLIGLVLLPLAGLHLWSIYDRMEYRVEQELHASEELARLGGTAVSSFLEAAWAHNQFTGAQIAARLSGGEAEIRWLLEHRKADAPLIRTVDWLGVDGTVLVSTDPRLEGVDLSEREYVERLMHGQEQLVSDLVLSPDGRELLFVVANAILRDGAVVGYITTSYDSADLGRVLPFDRAGAARLVIVDSKGMIVYWYGSDEAELPLERRRIDNPQGPVHRVLATGQPARIRSYLAVIDGQERMGAAVPVPGVGWVIAATNRVAEVLAPARQQALIQLTLLVGVSLGALVAAGALAARIVSAARSLQEAALAYAGGESAAAADLWGTDELSAAAAMFGHLAGTVRRTRAELRRKAAELALVLEATTDGFFTMDHEGRLTYVNRHAAAMLGRSRNALLGRRAHEVFPEVADPPFGEKARVALAQGKAISFEQHNPAENRWLEIDLYPFASGLAAFMREITARREAEEALRSETMARELERRRLQSVLGLLPVGVLMVDAAGRLIEVNQAATRIWGGTPMARSIAEYEQYRSWWHATGSPVTPAESVLARALTTGESPTNEEVDIETFDGRRLTILASAVPLRDESGAIIGAVAAHVDVTEQKRMEADLRRQSMTLERQRAILEHIAVGAPLPKTLRLIERLVEEGCPRSRCSVLLPMAESAETPRHPEGESCWESVVRGPTGEPICRVVLYCQEGVEPAPEALALAQTAVHLARIAIESRQREAEPAQKLATLVAHVSEGVIAVDAAGEVIWQNEAAARLLGMEGSLALRSFRELALPEPLVAALEEALGANGTTVLARLEVGDLCLEARVSPVHSDLGRFGALAVISDITAQERFRRLQESLIANVSHELRGPLASMSATLEALHDGVIPEEARGRYMRALLEEMARLRRLSYDVVDLTRLDLGELEVLCEPVPLGPLLHHIEDSFASRCAASGLRLIVEPTAAVVMGNADRITQVVTNLLENALRFTPAGGLIRVQASAEEGAVRITVSDTGVGIPPESLPLIWDRFYKVDRARTFSPGTGSGLGLAIAKQLVELMGGEVHVVSELSRGSTFSFTLPLAP
ncbi:MAG: PAS domain-containing protein [Bacillota bacterium]